MLPVNGALVAGFAAVALLTWRRPPASPFWSWPGLTIVVCAAVLLLASLWVNSRRSDRPRTLTVLQAVNIALYAYTLLAVGLVLPGSPGQAATGVGIVTACTVTATLLLATLLSADQRLQRAWVWAQRSAAEQDDLTGLVNRAGLQREAAERLGRERQQVVMIDMNSLKLINDLDGHGAGDAFLQRFAALLRAHLPTGAVAGRWGGDEFLLLLPQGAGAEPLMADLLAAMDHPKGVRRAFSYGVAVGERGAPFEQILALADQRMYEQKAALGEEAASSGIGYGQLQSFSQYLLQLSSVEGILSEGLQRGLDILGFDGITYLVLSTDEDLQLQPVAWLPPQLAPTPLRLQVASGPLMLAVTTRATQWDADFLRRSDLPQAIPQGQIRSLLVTPVLTGGAVRGVLCALSLTTWRAITPQNRLVLEVLATHLGHALERQQVVDDLQLALEGSIRKLGIALEMRDLETAGHTDRVTELALRFAQALGLSTEQRNLLRLGAYLHDVGKLSLPDRVLLKPGRLDAAERALIETHTLRGAELVSRMPNLAPEITGIVLSHHERWNGQGYPHGLAGEDIPLLARLFALCDVYDALTSERPYKEAWTAERALDELQAQRGQQFDPQLTDAFVRFLRST